MLYADSALPAYSLVSPFTNETITPPAQPFINNTLGGINSTTATNSTGGDDISIWDITDYAWNSTIFVVQLLTGGFIWDALTSWGIPTEPLLIFQGVLSLFMILTVLHFWRGIL